MTHVLYTRKFERDGFMVIVSHVLDDNPDTSYLMQEYEDCEPEERAEYKAQDAARLKAYYNEEWCYMGVCVDIRKQTSTNWANGGLEVGHASVWGIESDSEPSYIAEVEGEEINEAFAEVDVAIFVLNALKGVK